MNINLGTHRFWNTLIGITGGISIISGVISNDDHLITQGTILLVGGLILNEVN